MLRRVILSTAVLAAITGCGEAPQLSPTQQALHQLRSGQYDEAIATSSKAIHAAPDEAENYLYRGRAYHYRNAMGDHGRAIADYSEAIRRAPKSSDAYYSRALAYRDLGEVKLATADEEQARELDRGLRDVYNRLPNESHLTEIAKETPQSDAAAEPEGTGGDSKKSEEDERKLYEELKDRFEPGFGTIRSSKKSDEEMVADELQKAQGVVPIDDGPAQLLVAVGGRRWRGQPPRRQPAGRKRPGRRRREPAAGRRSRVSRERPRGSARRCEHALAARAAAGTAARKGSLGHDTQPAAEQSHVAVSPAYAGPDRLRSAAAGKSVCCAAQLGNRPIVHDWPAVQQRVFGQPFHESLSAAAEPAGLLAVMH